MNNVIVDESQVSEFVSTILNLLEKDMKKPSTNHLFSYLQEKTGIFSEKISEEKKWELIEFRFVNELMPDAFSEAYIGPLFGKYLEKVVPLVISRLPPEFWKKVKASQTDAKDLEIAEFVTAILSSVIIRAEMMKSADYQRFLSDEKHHGGSDLVHLDQRLILLAMTGIFLRKWGTEASFRELSESAGTLHGSVLRRSVMAAYSSAIDFVNSEVQREVVLGSFRSTRKAAV